MKMKEVFRQGWGKRILWVAVILSVIFVLGSIIYDLKKTDNWESYTTQNSGLVQNRVFAIAFDSSDRIWFGTSDGVSVFDGKNWQSYTTQNSGLINDSVGTIAFDSADRAWFGTSDGISVLDGENWENYTTQNSGLINDHVNSIAIDSSDRVWIGTNKGVSVFDGKNWRGYKSQNSGLVNDTVHTIAIDSSDRIWFGTYGISVFDGESWKSYTTKNSGILADSVHTITIDPSDRLWIGTKHIGWGTNHEFKAADGVSVFDGENWETYTTKNSDLVDERQISITFDSSDRAWIGTYKGVSIFDGENWLTLTEENSGILNKDVEVIGTDNKGFMWIGTRDGINRIPIDKRFHVSPFFTSLRDLFFSPKLSLWLNLILLIILGNVGVLIDDRSNAIDKPELTSGKDQLEEKKITKRRLFSSPGASGGGAGGFTSSIIVNSYIINNVGLFVPEHGGLELLVLVPMLCGMAILGIAVSLVLIGPLSGIAGVKVFKTKKVAFLSGFLASLILSIPFIWIFQSG